MQMQQPSAPAFFRVSRAQITNLMFAIAASLPFALLFLLILGLALGVGKARAEAGLPVCEGRNLVEELAVSAPGRLAKARADAAATKNGTGLLWKIEKPGLAPSWLFGTMHVTDPRVRRIPREARIAFNSATTVVIETTDILDPAKAQAAVLSKPELTMFTDGNKLTSYLNDENAKLLRDELSRRGIPLSLVVRMKPWMVAGMVALPQCELDRKAAGAVFLDIRIANSAKAAGKRLLGLESIGEQMSAMADLPMEFHVRGLVETIRLGDLMPDILATMTELYLAGEIAMIMPVIMASAPNRDTEVSIDGYARFEERIITMRNHVMAERAGPILEDGNAFIAVGALHLPGREGLVSLLQNAGYTVTAVH